MMLPSNLILHTISLDKGLHFFEFMHELIQQIPMPLTCAVWIEWHRHKLIPNQLCFNHCTTMSFALREIQLLHRTDFNCVMNITVSLIKVASAAQISAPLVSWSLPHTPFQSLLNFNGPIALFEFCLSSSCFT